MGCEMPDEALGVARKATGEGNLLTKGHLEYLVGILVHEGRPAHDQLVGEEAKSVPVRGPAMTNVQYDLRRDVLWCAAESVGAIPRL